VSSGKLCVIHVPRHILLEAVAGIIPASYETIVFSQWSEDKDSMMIGFSDGPPPIYESALPDEMVN